MKKWYWSLYRCCKFLNYAKWLNFAKYLGSKVPTFLDVGPWWKPPAIRSGLKEALKVRIKKSFAKNCHMSHVPCHLSLIPTAAAIDKTFQGSKEQK